MHMFNFFFYVHNYIRKGNKKSFSRRKDGGQVGGGGGLKRGRCESPDLKKEKIKKNELLATRRRWGGGRLEED